MRSTAPNHQFLGTFPQPSPYLIPSASLDALKKAPRLRTTAKEPTMTGEFIGLVAVVLTLGIPVAGMYTYYHVRKLRTQERLAAMARGVEIPMVPDLSESARSRRAAILLCSGAIGIMMAFGMIAQIEHDPEVWVPAAFAVIPLAVGIGYFLDFTLIRRDASAQ